ncbi:hypothetical protein EDD85DRAFT_955143 [Armillaria nabsnona]|nr:hypothetical protein EDD85DRAFT_955143 [Armillaria nabsnona]
MSSSSSHQRLESAHLYTMTDRQKSMSSLASAASEQRRTFLEKIGLQRPKAELTPIQELPSSSFQLPALPPMLFTPPLPYPLQTSPSNFADSSWSREVIGGLSPPDLAPPSRDGVGNNSTIAAPPTLATNDLGNLVAPSVAVPTPTNHVEDPEYPSILSWNQPVSGSQYERIPFDKSSAPEPYSQEPTPEPIAGPSQPPRQRIIITKGTEIRRRPRDWWPSKTSSTTIATEVLPTKAYLNVIHGVHTNRSGTPLRRPTPFPSRPTTPEPDDTV